MDKYAIILAGGKGSRLWPISTQEKPKQFLNLYSSDIMINETIKRIDNIFECRNIFVIINKSQEEIAYRYIDYRIPRENIIIEPLSRSTAMCIFYATLKIQKMRGNGVISIFSSDHYIIDKNKLVETIQIAIDVANSSNSLVTIGIRPTYPATEFGYIKYDKSIEQKVYTVEEFREKPNYEKANKYFKSNQYLWNSGMFIWTIDSILKSFEVYLPNIYRFKNELYNAIHTNKELDIVEKIYIKVEPISIDNGILEKSKNIKVIQGDFE